MIKRCWLMSCDSTRLLRMAIVSRAAIPATPGSIAPAKFRLLCGLPIADRGAFCELLPTSTSTFAARRSQLIAGVLLLLLLLALGALLVTLLVSLPLLLVILLVILLLLAWSIDLVLTAAP